MKDTESKQLSREIRSRADLEMGFPPFSLMNTEDEEKTPINWRAYLESIRKHLWLIIGLALLVTLTTTVYMARKPDVYGAAARVQIDLESNPAIDVNGKPMVISNPSTAPDYFETQLEILRGPGLLRRVVKTLDLENNRAFFRPETGQRTTWQRIKDLVGIADDPAAKFSPKNPQDVLMTATVAPPTDRENLAEIKRLTPIVGSLQSNLQVDQIGHTRLVEIRFTHRDPLMAAKVVNAIADTFVLTNLERMSETNAGAAAFLKKRIADLQSQIRNGEERLLNYAREHEIVSLDATQASTAQRLSDIKRQIMEAENERKLAEAAYRAALVPGAVDVLTADSGLQSGAENKLMELRQRLAELRVEYTDKWPEIRLVQEQIKELEKQMSQMRARSGDVMLKGLERKFREAQQKEQLFRESFDQQRNLTMTENAAAINYKIIQQEIQTNQQLLNALMQRYKENDVILAGTPNNVRVADYANTPDSPIGPQRTRGIAVAFVLSLVLGVGVALLRELANNTVRTTADVENKVCLPALAVVPTVKRWPNQRMLPKLSALLPGRNGFGNGRPLLLYDDVPTPLAEVYRKLRTTVLLSTNGSSPKTLLVTSSLPTEGKTTTAVNMAVVMAKTGADVLIIDADLRQPTLHEIFQVSRDRGLSNLLTEDLQEQEILSGIILDTESGLNILPAGPLPQNPAELLSSPKMAHLLQVLSKSFARIIIDSPPVISFTDSVLISTLVDGVVLVVHGGKSSPEVVQHSRKELLDVGANIFGVVLNNVEQTPQDNYYYYGYSRPA